VEMPGKTSPGKERLPGKKERRFWNGPGPPALLAAFFLVHSLIFFLTGIVSFEGMRVAGVDPVCYYSFLRSMVFDGDLDFENEYRALDPQGVLLGYPLTPRGRRPNGFSIGPALAVSPFYLAIHAGVNLAGGAADGFSPPYHVSCFFALALYSLAGLILLFYWLKLFFDPRIAFAGTAITWFASSAVYYAWPMAFMPHAVSAFFVILFLFYTKKTRGRCDSRRWIVTGILIGLMSLVRWQNGLFVLFLWPDLRTMVRKRILVPLLFAAGTALVALLPQLIAWQLLYGRFFTVPQGSGFLLWSRPAIGRILFSTFNGLFTWTPVTLLAILGLSLQLGKKAYRTDAILLFILFLLQLFLNSTVRDWHGSWGFGMRRFMNCLPVFAVGVGFLLKILAGIGKGGKIRLALPCMALSLLALWNYLFLVQYQLHLVARNRPLTFHELVTDKLHLYTSIQRRRLVRTAYLSGDEGWWDDVEKALSLAEEIDPNHADIYIARGCLAARQGHIEEAFHSYRRALEIAPRDRDVHTAIRQLRQIRDETD